MTDDGLNERQRAAKLRHELSQQALELEAERAKVLIDEFLVSIKAAGIAPQPLKATTLDGHVVKTDKVGWYLRTNRSLGLDTEGNYYVLTVPGGFMERFRGVKLRPSLAPMTIGKGGRDGETGDLKEFLDWVLDGTIPQ
ncbi:MAG: hypothetical protein IPJ61_03800 [Tessaracoccus sp.]|uniref:hypothetical protein n=1 Tax=Tessaracoccus sp. TaxID=1971211 RepID=UPI001EBF99C3|nr:hypothetical protein [Tessaracoccus sp.]MBK7820204.1 hypothetical protein [Tessaracoccus sp.]